jgi:hypothetical protein
MDVIHFTRGATDPLQSFGAKGVSFLPLADGTGDTDVSCVRLDPGDVIDAPSLTHAATLLAAHARGISTPERIAGQTWPNDVLLE